MKKVNYPKLLLFVLGSEVIGASGSIFTAPAIGSWYAMLNKPFFTPPNWLFGPAWTLLFALMGTAAYIVHEKGIKNKKVRAALTVFAIQFVFNILWSVIFFGAKLPTLAFVEIVVLWGLIFLTIRKFSEVSKVAGYLLVPYLLWVTYAAALNLAVAVLN